MLNVGIRGSLTVSDGGCGGCGGGDGATRQVSLGGAFGACADAGLQYESAVAAPVTVSTSGLIGSAYVDLPLADSFTSVELLVLQTSARVRLRFDPTRPQLVGSAAVPGGGVTSGTATFVVTTDAGAQTSVPVTFSGGTNTPALVAAAINAAFASAGVQPPCDGAIARLSVGNVLTIVNPGVGPSAFLTLQAGAPAGLGLGTSLVTVEGTSKDTPDVEGLAIFQFPRYPGAPTRVQVSGVASIDLVVAGRVTA